MPRRRAQFALLGVVILATTLVVIVSQQPVEPVFALERGPMQSAQLVHLARYCLAVGCSNETLAGLVAGLLALNGTEPLYMYPVTRAHYYRSEVGGLENRTVAFTVVTLRGEEVVALKVLRTPGIVQSTFTKQVHEHTLIFHNVTFAYMHFYESPFFPGGRLTYCPRLQDPAGLAELRYLGYCTWYVSAPSGYTLYDEFGIPVAVRVPGG